MTRKKEVTFCLSVALGRSVPINSHAAAIRSPEQAKPGFTSCLQRTGPQKNLGCIECWVDALLMALVVAFSMFLSLLSKIRQVQLVYEIISVMFSLIHRTNLGRCCGFQQRRTPLGYVWSLFLNDRQFKCQTI